MRGSMYSAEDQILNEIASPGQLDEAIRVRTNEGSLAELDRLEAFFQGQGYRHVKRSHLVRIAIDRLICDMITEHPEIQEIVIRSTRS